MTDRPTDYTKRLQKHTRAKPFLMSTFQVHRPMIPKKHLKHMQQITETKVQTSQWA